MTDSQSESDDQHTTARTEPVAGQPLPPADDRLDTARGKSIPAPLVPGRQQTGGVKAGLIVAYAIGLVALFGIGVAIGLYAGANHGNDASAAAVTSSGTVSHTPAPSTTPAGPSAAPGNYSMSAVNDACDLVDTKPLTKWSSKPTPPQHLEYPSLGGGSLLCQIQYTSTSPVDGVSTDEAAISLQVQFAPGVGGLGYDPWKSDDTAPQSGWNSGTITGLGAQGYWGAGATTDPSLTAKYIVGVQDSNISVRVEVFILRAQGEAPLNLDDLKTIAQSQARIVLDRLKKP